jgi:hypothetical protein
MARPLPENSDSPFNLQRTFDSPTGLADFGCSRAAVTSKRGSGIRLGMMCIFA